MAQSGAVRQLAALLVLVAALLAVPFAAAEPEPPPPVPPPAPTVCACTGEVKQDAYNPAAYVPGGSTLRVAVAIQMVGYGGVAEP